MDQMNGRFAGVYTAIITPFRDQAVDYDAYDALVERQIEAGEAGIVVAGTTGESATLSKDEIANLVTRTKKAAGSRVLVMAGAGSNSTATTLEKIASVEAAGADAVLIVTPYYNKPSQAGLVAHFGAAAEATGLPVMLYSVPGRCAVEIAPQTCAVLATTYRNIVGIKEAGGSTLRVTQIRQACGPDFAIHCGDDGLTLPFLSVGAIGVTSVVSNVAPREMVQLLNAWKSGDVRRALAIHEAIAELCDVLFVESNPAPAKAALALAGLSKAELRLPLVEMAESNLAKLKAALDRFELSRATLQEIR